MPAAPQLPYALYRAEQVREFDRITIEEFGVPAAELMQRAGAAAFRLLRQAWPAARRILIVAGAGNNGGDGWVVGRLAQQAGLEPLVICPVGRDRLSPLSQSMAEAYLAASGRLAETGFPADAEVIVDALFGTGLSRDLAPPFSDLVAAINAHPAPVLALDIPSGLEADSGRVLGIAVEADRSISFIGLKRGMFTGSGPQCSGAIEFDGLNVPARVYSSQIADARRLDWARLRPGLPRRSRSAHKGHYGHVLVLGGELGMGGAALLASQAALRAGAGLVSLATRPQHVAAALAARPELMVLGVERSQQLGDILRQASVIAVGPGLGQAEWGQSLWRAALEAGRPLVVDADALTLLAGSPMRRDDWILTPHPGEAARLLGLCPAEVQADRFAAVQALQTRYGGVIVLKGAGTLIAAAGRAPAVCSEGNPGMASGGMGDLLTGIIAGLLAQGFTPAEAAELGVCLHARAGDLAAQEGERGLLASDLLQQLRLLVNRP